jgi:hypothetical protein
MQAAGFSTKKELPMATRVVAKSSCSLRWISGF